jgi:hypothetical protein
MLWQDAQTGLNTGQSLFHDAVKADAGGSKKVNF